MRVKKLIATVLLGTQLTYAGSALADDRPVPTVEQADPGAVISPLEKGQQAPFAGVLLSSRAIANIIAELESFGDQMAVEVQHARDEEKAQRDFIVANLKTEMETNNKVYQAQIDARKKDISILEDRIKKTEEDRPNVVLWTSLGVVGGVGITLLTVFAVSQASK